MPPAVVTRSPLAIQAAKQWNAEDRPAAWIPIFGAFTHTTGGGLPLKAEATKRDPLVLAAEVYNKTHGCNYVIGWAGLAGGLLQLADEREQASGVGISAGARNQWDEVKAGPGAWKKDLPAALVKRWGERWPGYANPLDLLPGSKYANAPYVQIEMIPCVYGGKRKDLPAPLAPGLRFTRAQHDAVAALYVDLAKRHSWPDEWWRTPRVVGHEDVTPASRHDKNGGWDPGWLRAQPYFDWPHVIREIGRLLGMAEIDDTKKPRSLVYNKPGPWSKF